MDLTIGIVSHSHLQGVKQSFMNHQEQEGHGLATVPMHGTLVHRSITTNATTFFVPDTRAYRVSGSAKLFPQHCQVPFLMWNKNFQEVIDELATTIREVPPNQRAKLLKLVYKRLQLDKSNNSPRTLIDESHT
jgi:hypothetical protein